MSHSVFSIEGYNVVLEALKATNGEAVDDHGQAGHTRQLAGVAALVKGDKIIPVALCDSRYFSVNMMYVEDGKAHIGRNSVGGVVQPMNHGMDVLEAVKAYNEEQASYPLTSGQLEHVYMFDQASPIKLVDLDKPFPEDERNVTIVGRIKSLNVDFEAP